MAGLTISPINPIDGGTAVINLSFTDEDDNAVVPSNLQFQLSNKLGDIMNGRDFNSSSFTGTEIVLSGDDLLLQSISDEGDRYLAVKGVYNSSAGTNLPIIGEVKFTIENLRNIAPVA